MEAVGRTGTLTFLFTDIESSTSLWDRFPAAMAVSLARHDQLVYEVVEEHQGTVFAEGGDGFGAVFGSADDGVAAAVALQQRVSLEPWATPVPMSVRMGLHTGTAEVRDGNYFGTAVNRAARVSARARGGQVLVSAATAALVASSGQWALVDLGLHDLKGLERAAQLFEVGTASRGATVPTAGVATALVGNVPRRQTGLIGRDADLGHLIELLLPGAVVMLRGPGGVGKTRLALAAADECRTRFSDGAWFVDLSGTTDAGAVCAATWTALELFVPGKDPSAPDVASALGGQHRLVVIDNCEHVLDDVAALVDALVTRCPRVGILLTSRERLGHPVERVLAVKPLQSDGDIGAPSDAGRLLLERVTGRVPEFVPTVDDLEGVEEICRLVDGVPLAIELAAAQIGTLGVSQVLRRMMHAMTLTDPYRRGSTRHRSLRDAIAWSYDLLGADERLVFDWLSVFPHSFDLEAAEAVGSPSNLDVATVLTALVEKSLVSIVRVDGLVRYRMLAMSREYGRDCLVARGQAGAVADSHARYFRSWCADADEGVRGPEEMRWHLGFTHEWDNVRAAYHHSLAHRDGDAVCQLLWRTGWWAQTRLRMEVADWAEAAQGLPEARSSPHFAMALAMAAAFARLRNHTRLADRLLLEAEGLEGEYGPSPQPWVVWERLRYLRYTGAPNAEGALAELTARATHDPVWRVMIDFQRHQLDVTRCAWSITDDAASHDLRAAVERALLRAEALGAPTFLARAHFLVANVERPVTPSRALERLEHAVALAQAAGNLTVLRECSMDAVQLRGITGSPREALIVAAGLIEDYLRANAEEPATSIALALFPAFVALGEYQAAATIAHALRSDPAGRPIWIEFIAPEHLVEQLERASGPIAELALPARSSSEFLRIVRRQIAEALTRSEGP